MTASFSFLDDVALADAAFDAAGNSPSELLTAAAQAVIETMVDPETVSPAWAKDIRLEASDLAELLFEWLCALVYVKDEQGVVFRSATAAVSQDGADGVWRLAGTVAGEPIDHARHELRADVKAVTKHLYRVQQDGNQWTARVVLDI
jgi:SHS2 domain-containing protein